MGTVITLAALAAGIVAIVLGSVGLSQLRGETSERINRLNDEAMVRQVQLDALSDRFETSYATFLNQSSPTSPVLYNMQLDGAAPSFMTWGPSIEITQNGTYCVGFHLQTVIGAPATFWQASIRVIHANSDPPVEAARGSALSTPPLILFDVVPLRFDLTDAQLPAVVELSFETVPFGISVSTIIGTHAYVTKLR